MRAQPTRTVEQRKDIISMYGGTQWRSASGKRTGRLGVETDTIFHFIVFEYYCVLNFFIYWFNGSKVIRRLG